MPPPSPGQCVAKVEREAEKELLRAADASRRVEKQAAAKVAAAAKSVAKAEKKAGIDSLRAADSSRKAVKRAAKEVATAAENVAKAKKNLDKLAKRARVAESSAAASAAESRAHFSGDVTSPRLTKKGRSLAAEVQELSTREHETKVKRLMRHLSSEAKAREKAKDLAKTASDKAEKLTLQRDKARAEKRRSGKKLAKTHAATAKLKNGGSSSATHKLPGAFRARIEAAEADAVAAEVAGEALQRDWGVFSSAVVDFCPTKRFLFRDLLNE